MQNQIPSVVLIAAAIGLFVFASGLSQSEKTANAVSKSTDTKATNTVAVPSAEVPAAGSISQPTGVAAVQPNTAIAPVTTAQATPTVQAPPASQAVPAAQPAPTEKAVPTAPVAPVKKVDPAPVPTSASAAPAQPAAINGINRDDQPEKLTKSGKVVASTDASRPPAYGPTDAPVHVIVFSDFQCPVCKRAVDATHQIAEEFPGEVRLEFWQHALKMHPNAERAAAASLAAHRQGKFWAMHDKLFENQRALDENSLMTYAQGLGLDMEQFKKDFSDPTLRKAIADQGDFARAMGARGTPAFLINGKSSVGWGSWNGFRGQVLREVNKARDLKKAGQSASKIREARAKENAKDSEAFQRILNDALVPLNKG